MSQSSLVAALLFAMFIVFVAVNGRLAVYTDVLWGGGGKGGGTLAPDEKGDKSDDGKGLDKNAALDLGADFLPFPFNAAYDLADMFV